MTGPLAATLGALLLGVNLLTLVAFGYDKAQARRRQWRVSERTLLGLALLGGSPAAFWARAHFRHKTRKQPFSGLLIAIAIAQAVGIGWLLASSGAVAA